MDRERMERCLERVSAYRASGMKAKAWAGANAVELLSLQSWCAHAARWRARLVMVICLATGAALDAAIGPYQGKGSGELGLVRQVLGSFRPGDVMLADALYCNYFLIASLMAAGVAVLFEQNGSRITDFRRGQLLGTRDHIVRWPKPAARPQWMTHELYANAPAEIVLRECKVGHQVLVTTLH